MTTPDSTPIADRVRFWEEQDKINQELIPRVIRQHELLTGHIADHENLPLIAGSAISEALAEAREEQQRHYNAALEAASQELQRQYDAALEAAKQENQQQYAAALGSHEAGTATAIRHYPGGCKAREPATIRRRPGSR